MIRALSLWISSVVLLLSGCTEALKLDVERCLDLPDSLGALYIQLDTSMTQASSWRHPSDYKCGAEWVQCYAYNNWPMHRDTSYFTSRPDSLFQFTLRYSFYSPEECGWPSSIQDDRSTAEEQLAHMIHIRQLENPKWMPVAQGVLQIHGAQWTFLCTSDSLSLHNDVFESNTNYAGRTIVLTWQRIAPSRAPFNFEAYARRQFETARFD